MRLLVILLPGIPSFRANWFMVCLMNFVSVFIGVDEVTSP